MNFKKLFCNHDDSIIQEISMESEYEIAANSGQALKTHLVYLNTTRKHIVYLKCSKCSRVRYDVHKTV